MKTLEIKKHRLSFNQRLFWTLFLTFIGFTACFCIFQYQREHTFAQDKLNAVLESYNYQLWHRTQKHENFKAEVNNFINDIPQKELRVTIIDPKGDVLFDNSGAEEFNNHNNRIEVRKARLNNEGFAIRYSISTGKKYFYSATNIDGYIYRCALPYNMYLWHILTINKDFIYFMIIMLLIFFFVLSRYTTSIGSTISRLQDFAGDVERGQMPDNTAYSFPDDELGDIASNIVSLYNRQQKAQNEAYQEREEHARMKRQLTQNIAHELKTPVSSIQGYLETIMTNESLTNDKKEYFLERCYSQSTRLAGLLRDISLLNRLDEAGSFFDLESIDITQLIGGIEGECAMEMENKHITADVSLPGKPTIFGNQSLIYSIFRNLFDNAIAYAGEGSHIKVECYKEDEFFYFFRFSDNGIGIAPEHINHIFERFYRVDKGRSRKLGGTGLGLSIVKNAVLFHKGKISATSVLGEGTTFQFSLKKQISNPQSQTQSQI